MTGGAGAELGPYTLERRLGEGGFGAVWVGRHRATGARHALKVVEVRDAEHAARLARELEALARLEAHPHALRVHGSFALPGGRAVVVTELVEGAGDLGARLAQGPLPPAEAARLVREVASALAHAHARGVLHRDLKPQNVLVDAAGRARLIDLGLAHVAGGERLTRTGEVLGTPAYLAPEQALGQPADARTDVFGLGTLLFACLTGRPPRAGGAPLALLRRAAEEPLPPVTSLRPDVPAALAEVVAAATALDPARRPPTAEAFLAALDAATSGAAARARRRRRAAAALAALALTLVAAGAARVVVERRRAADERREVADATRAAATLTLERVAAGWRLGDGPRPLDAEGLTGAAAALEAALPDLDAAGRAAAGRTLAAVRALAAARAPEQGGATAPAPDGLACLDAARAADGGDLEAAEAALARARRTEEPADLVAAAAVRVALARVAAATPAAAPAAAAALVEALRACAARGHAVTPVLRARVGAALAAAQGRFAGARRSLADLEVTLGRAVPAWTEAATLVGLDPAPLAAARVLVVDQALDGLTTELAAAARHNRDGLRRLGARTPGEAAAPASRALVERLAALLRAPGRALGPGLHGAFEEVEATLVQSSRAGEPSWARVLCELEAYRFYGVDRQQCEAFDAAAPTGFTEGGPWFRLGEQRAGAFHSSFEQLRPVDPLLRRWCPGSRLLALAALQGATAEAAPARVDLRALGHDLRGALGRAPETLDDVALGQRDPAARRDQGEACRAAALAAIVDAAQRGALVGVPDAALAAEVEAEVWRVLLDPETPPDLLQAPKGAVDVVRRGAAFLAHVGPDGWARPTGLLAWALGRCGAPRTPDARQLRAELGLALTGALTWGGATPHGEARAVGEDTLRWCTETAATRCRTLVLLAALACREGRGDEAERRYQAALGEARAHGRTSAPGGEPLGEVDQLALWDALSLQVGVDAALLRGDRTEARRRWQHAAGFARKQGEIPRWIPSYEARVGAAPR